jgi:hypothetical protein
MGIPAAGLLQCLTGINRRVRDHYGNRSAGAVFLVRSTHTLQRPNLAMPPSAGCYFLHVRHKKYFSRSIAAR